jgi:hypothetical protein
MESCFLFTFRVTLGSFCGCVEPQIKESWGPWWPDQPCPGWWDSPLFIMGLWGLGLWTRGT